MYFAECSGPTALDILYAPVLKSERIKLYSIKQRILEKNMFSFRKAFIDDWLNLNADFVLLFRDFVCKDAIEPANKSYQMTEISISSTANGLKKIYFSEVKLLFNCGVQYRV